MSRGTGEGEAPNREVDAAIIAGLQTEREMVEIAVRKVCPLDNNEGYEDEDEGRVMYRCLNEDGDAFIETESLAQAVEGIVASYDRVCGAFEAKCEEACRLTAEVERLRGVMEGEIEWLDGEAMRSREQEEAEARLLGVSPSTAPMVHFFNRKDKLRAALALPTPAPEAAPTPQFVVHVDPETGEHSLSLEDPAPGATE